MEFNLETIKNGPAGNRPITILPLVGSTNDELKKMAASGAPSGTVLLAECQTAGKGRLGRTFFSPPGGYYMSLLLRPPALTQEDAGMLTVFAATLTASVLDELTGLKIGIKWVNDLYVDQLKICGILVEAATDSANGGLAYAIIGIGINLTAELFPHSAGVAGSIQMAGGRVPDKNELASLLLQRLDGLCRPALGPYLLAEYRRRSILLGQYIRIVGGDGQRLLATGIDDSAGLVVMNEDKSFRTLRCGEVSTVLDDSK